MAAVKYINPIKIQRGTPPFVDVCDFCGSFKKLDKDTLCLKVTSPNLVLELCPDHEAMLIEILVNNYVKRTRKRKVRGLPPPFKLRKEKDVETGRTD